MTKSLTGIVSAEDVVQNSEYLQTLMVVIPKYVPFILYSLITHPSHSVILSVSLSCSQDSVQGVVELL